MCVPKERHGVAPRVLLLAMRVLAGAQVLEAILQILQERPIGACCAMQGRSEVGLHATTVGKISTDSLLPLTRVRTVH